MECQIDNSRSCIQPNRSLATCAIRHLKGSALGEGMNCINQNNCSVSTTSVNCILPSAADNFKPIQIVTISFPSSNNLFFNTLQFTIRQHCHSIHYRKIPFPLIAIPHRTNTLLFENFNCICFTKSQLYFHKYSYYARFTAYHQPQPQHEQLSGFPVFSLILHKTAFSRKEYSATPATPNSGTPFP